MNNGNLERLLSPLRIALRLEREGQQFFAQAARRVTDKSARQTFEFLAAEEDKHIRRIEEFYCTLERSEGQEIPDSEDSDADLKLARFNDRMVSLKDEIKPTLSDIEAYKTALKFENGTEDFYTQQVAEATDPRIKRFYMWLINEEAMHARVLSSCVRFAENPAGWFKNR